MDGPWTWSFTALALDQLTQATIGLASGAIRLGAIHCVIVSARALLSMQYDANLLRVFFSRF